VTNAFHCRLNEPVNESTLQPHKVCVGREVFNRFDLSFTLRGSSLVANAVAMLAAVTQLQLHALAAAAAAAAAATRLALAPARNGGGTGTRAFCFPR